MSKIVERMERRNPHHSLIESRMSLVAWGDTKVNFKVSFANPTMVSIAFSMMLFPTRKTNVRQNRMLLNILQVSYCLSAPNLLRELYCD